MRVYDPSEGAAAKLARVTCGCLCAALCVLAAFWSARLAWADMLSRTGLAECEKAARLDPANALILMRWSDALRQAGRDDRAVLERVAALRPWDAAPRIRLALEAEMRGDPGEARRLLEEAAGLSRTFEPQWTLANFYLRRGDEARFWAAVRAALAVSVYGPPQVYELCRRVGAAPETVLDRVMPDRPPLLESYLNWLSHHGDPAGARAVAQRLAPRAGQGEAPSLTAWCTRAIENGLAEDALAVWNTLASHHAVPYPPLDAVRGPCLTNGSFTREPLGAGFDWRYEHPLGVSLVREPSQGLRVSFSGRQAERCRILAQFVPVRPGLRYRLRCRSRAIGIPRAVGLVWRVQAGATGLAALEAAGDERGAEFRAPPGRHAVEIALVYDRAPGTTRIEGTVALAAVSMESVP